MKSIREVLEGVPVYAAFREAKVIDWDEFVDQITRIDREEQRRATLAAPVDLPPRFRRAVFGLSLTDSQARAERVFGAWVASSPTGNAYLWGPSMAGKTHMGCAMLREASAGGMACRYASFLDVARNSAPGQGNRQEIVRALAATPLLMLDDVAVECGDGTGAVNPMQEWKRELLREIVYARYNAGLPTLYISLLSPVQLVAALDAALGRRMIQDLAVAL